MLVYIKFWANGKFSVNKNKFTGFFATFYRIDLKAVEYKAPKKLSQHTSHLCEKRKGKKATKIEYYRMKRIHVLQQQLCAWN